MIKNNLLTVSSILIAGVFAAVFVVYGLKHERESEGSAVSEVVSPEKKSRYKDSYFVENSDEFSELEELREKSEAVNAETLKIKKQTIVDGKEISSVDQAISDRDSSIVRTATMKMESNATGSYTVPAESDQD
ncbi:hypothetical protein [Microbulbifer halophilus]|uniref:Uncharacterized protein n=1 Tax=Microbulbifer halophilus TaxID=453963 RepID=A0ABW5ECU3_9GAMM|nr:hypothetical protein [Microbulbifer halophilus]MCW8127018.1 hypothetical protein [Microbulbifer halophilus]